MSGTSQRVHGGRGERGPWYLAPFFPADALPSQGLLRMLGFVALGLAFESYDFGLLNSALPQIAAELGIPAGDLGFNLAAIRIGGLAALVVLPFSDRLGRRRVFLACLLAMTLSAFATAFCQTALQYTVLQTVMRTFALSSTALAIVIVIEEFPAAQRGGAIAALTLLGGLGYGVAVGLYAAVDWLPFGWRSLYALSGTFFFALPLLRRSLRETSRFERERAERTALASPALESWLEPLRELVRTHPRRAALFGLAATLAAMSSLAVMQYGSYFVQTAHGWGPAQYSGLFFAGGVLGMFGGILGGRGSDRFGRRRVVIGCLAGAPLGAALFYSGPSALLIPAWGLFIFCTFATDVVMRALSAELFPTSHRGTAAGWRIAVDSVGATLGLSLVGALTVDVSDLAPVLSAVSCIGLLAAVCLWFLPETSGRELETLEKARPRKAPVLAAIPLGVLALVAAERVEAGEDWQRVASQDGFYVAWLPAEPQPIVSTRRSVIGRTTSIGSHFVQGEQGEESCQLTATELPAVAQMLTSSETLYEYSRDNFLRAVGGSPNDFRDQERNGIGGKVLEWGSSSTRGRVEFYVHAGRIYVFGCEVATNSSRELIDVFFSRLELSKPHS